MVLSPDGPALEIQMSWCVDVGKHAHGGGMREPDQRQGVAELKPVKGKVICAGTGQGNIAVLVMERVDVDSSDDLTAVLAQVTVLSDGECDPIGAGGSGPADHSLQPKIRWIPFHRSSRSVHLAFTAT